MSATIFLALCILGCDVLLYFLFQWSYGEKRRGLARRAHSRLTPAASHKTHPIEFVPARRKSLSASSTHNSAFRLSQIEETRQDRRIERQAYERIAATFAEARR
jgi:hypothetical protein